MIRRQLARRLALSLTLAFACQGILLSSSAQVENPTPAFSAPAPQNIPSPLDPLATPPDLQGVLKPPLSANSSQTTLVGLVQAFDEALLKHPKAASVRAQLGIAKSAYFQALTLPNPSFLVYNGMRAEQTYQVGASIPLEPPWKLVLRLITAKKQVKLADLQIMSSLWTLRADVRRAFLELVVAQETVVTLKDLVELSNTLQDVAQKRFQAGDVPELDVLKARLATSQANIDYNNGLRRVEQAKQLLNNMLGRPFEDTIEVGRLPSFKVKVQSNELLPNLDQTPPPVRQYVNEAIENRLEVKIVKQQIKATQADFNSSIGNIIPNPQLNVGNSITGNPPDGPKIKKGYFIGVTQELPILNFQQGDLARLNSALKQLKMELGSERNRITGQVASAYQQMMAARERIKAYREHVLDDSQEVARLARRSYEVGQSDITSTLQAQQANVAIRGQYLDAVQAYQMAFTDLEQSVGRPLQ